MMQTDIQIHKIYNCIKYKKFSILSLTYLVDIYIIISKLCKHAHQQIWQIIIKLSYNAENKLKLADLLH